MHITLAIVLSVDGKSTKWNFSQVKDWTSNEDQKHISNLISNHNLIVMGRNTYEAAEQHIKPSADKLRIILTSTPKNYKKKQIDGQLEFSDESLEVLIKRLENSGFTKMLLLSGQGLNQLFFEKNLVDELILTLEPKIFGTGNGLTSDAKLDINLKLESVEKLNDAGTLLLKYKVLK